MSTAQGVTSDWVSETKRLCQRYIDEVVLAFDLCPWAAPALQNGRVQMSVITDICEAPSGLVSAAQEVFTSLHGSVPDEIELVLVLLPRARFSRLQMDELLRQVRDLQRLERTQAGDAARSQSEKSFALAAFHPDAEPNDASPEQLIPFLRRSPDPMIQAVRSTTLSRVERNQNGGTAYFDVNSLDLGSLSTAAPNLGAAPPEPLRLRIARQNAETMQRVGLPRVSDLLDEIALDRARTHAKLLRERT